MNLSSLLSILKIRLLVIIVALGIGLVFMIALIVSIFAPTPPSQTTPSPLPRIPDKRGAPIVIPDIVLNDQPTFLNYSQIAIGETSASEISKMAGLIDIKNLVGGGKQFEFTSTDPLRNNMVETENDKAIFKRVVSVTASDFQTPSIYTYTESYGIPEVEFTGSKRYGPYMKTYIYPSKGFALITNPYTNEVFEIQSFKPTTLEQYKARWGEDISEQMKIEEINNDKVY